MGDLARLFNPRRSIQARLSLLAGGAALLVILLLAFGVARHVENLIQADQGERMTEIAHYMATDLDRTIYQRKHEILFFSTLIRLRDAKFSALEKRNLLNAIQKENPVYTWLGMVDKNGTIIAGTGGLLEGVDASQRDYFLEGQKGFFAGDVHDAFLLSKVLPRPGNDLLPLRLVDVAAPIHDMAGQFAGVLIGHMSLEWAESSRRELLQSSVSPDALDVMVLKKNGAVLIGPSTDFVLRRNMQDEVTLRQLAQSPASSAVATWSDGVFLTGKATSTGYRDFEGFGWQVMVRKPVDRALGEARRVHWQILGVGGLAILILSVLGWYLVGYIVKPLRNIAMAAEKIRQGDPTVRIPLIPGRDEAALLSASLAKLVNGLRDSNHALEARVARRTAELTQHAQMIDLVSDAIIRVDTQRIIRECNAGAARMFGYTINELTGLPLQQLYLPDDWPPTASFVNAELVHKEKTEFFPRYVKKSGEQINAHVVIRQVRDAQGAPQGYIAYIMDVTAQVAMEKRFALAQQIAHFGIWEWDMTSNALLWSEEIYRIFGLESSQFEASYPAFFDRIHPQDRDKVSVAVQRAVDSDWAYEVEHRIVRPNGEVRHVQENGQVYRDGMGKPIRMVGVVHDITERMRSEKQLELFRQLIEKSKDPIYLMDIDDGARLVYVNQAAVDHWGVPRETILTWRLPDWDPHFTVDKIADLVNFARTSPGQLIETEHRIGDGSRVPVSVSANILELDDKVYVFGYFKNISERKRIETELSLAKEQAESASLAKSEFLANMSHEIRTPMNAIIGLSHLCLQTRLDTQQRDYLTKVHGAANSLLRIINDVLDFSKIEAGKLEIEQVEFDLNEVMGSLVTVVSVRSEEKGLELLIDIPFDMPRRLVGDPVRLSQVLTNLASNAIKFTERGEIRIKVEPLEQRDNSLLLQFTVSDTGIGLTPEQIGKLFQAFTQADASTTRKFGGTGLGLSISKRLVDLMGGAIRVSSQVGQGSDFIFSIRCAIAPEQTRPAHRTAPQMRVLTVDDNDNALLITSTYVRSLGHAVDLAMNGRDAVQAIQKADEAGRPFDLILLDWKMPDMDGLAVAQQVRQELALKTPPKICMLTAYGKETAVRAAVDAHWVDGVLMKPVTPSTLFDTIMALNASSGGARATHAVPSPDAALSGMRVLLAEDNALNQQVAQELLKRAGVEVVTVSTGAQAVAEVDRTSFDAVLMDLQMPELDGFDATRTIRAQPRHATLPIVAMTANAMAGDREKCLAAGMNDHIAKPIDPQVLYATLALWGRPGAGSAPVRTSVTPVSPGEVPSPVLDVAMATARLAGDQALYDMLLERFLQDEVQAVESIRTALAADDAATARRLAHTLKGLAATVGANALSQGAAALESALNQGDSAEECLPLLEAVADDLVRVMAAAAAHLAGQGKSQEASALPGVELRPALERLIQQLENFDGEAGHTLREIEQHAQGSDWAARLAPLARKIADYDYEHALGDARALLELA